MTSERNYKHAITLKELTKFNENREKQIRFYHLILQWKDLRALI